LKRTCAPPVSRSITAPIGKETDTFYICDIISKTLAAAFFAVKLRPMRGWLLLCAFPAALVAVQYPASPEMPRVSEPRVEGGARPGGRQQTSKSEKVAQTTVKLKIHLGDKTAVVAEASIPATYSFTHKKGHLQYNQTVRAEDIRELAIESYRARRVSAGKEGEVFEFEPATVRLELKDGQVFKLNYLFKELRRLKAKNADGAFTVFAYFADTWKLQSWQERPGAVERPKEGVILVTRLAHPAAFTRLEYFEPVEKTPAAGEMQER
jgi:predicted HTH domain antitoxin